MAVIFAGLGAWPDQPLDDGPRCQDRDYSIRKSGRTVMMPRMDRDQKVIDLSTAWARTAWLSPSVDLTTTHVHTSYEGQPLIQQKVAWAYHRDAGTLYSTSASTQTQVLMARPIATSNPLHILQRIPPPSVLAHVHVP